MLPSSNYCAADMTQDCHLSCCAATDWTLSLPSAISSMRPATTCMLRMTSDSFIRTTDAAFSLWGAHDAFGRTWFRGRQHSANFVHCSQVHRVNRTFSSAPKARGRGVVTGSAAGGVPGAAPPLAVLGGACGASLTGDLSVSAAAASAGFAL